MLKQEQHSNLNDLEDEEQAGWIVTYADLMTLLLVFFVLLYSISSLNFEKFKEAMTSIQVSLGETAPSVGIMELAQDNPKEQSFSLEDVTGLKSRKAQMLKDIRGFIENKGMAENIEAHMDQGNIVVRMTGTILFNSGFAALNNEGKPLLDGIAEIVGKFSEFKVSIKGHTDNSPIRTDKFPSNWELSALRATTVLRYLIERGIPPKRLTATGYAQLMPLVPNNSVENRAKNRRVEFVLEKEKN